MTISSDSINYPYQREWCIDSIDFPRYVHLKKNWKQSKEIINQIRDNLSSKDLDDSIITVAAAGSVGRMEACKELSDADLIVILSDQVDPESDEAKQIYQKILTVTDDLGLEKPKKDGVFGKPTNLKQLLDNIGRITESYDIVGKRLLLLLETQPVYSNEGYQDIISQIIDRYAKGYVKEDSKKEWVFLLNDLIRYFRSLAVNYQSDFENDNFKWLLRNIKLRHSRLIMYSGLLTLIGEASRERKDKVKWLEENLIMTPLERIAWVYEQNKDWNFYRIAGLYDVFLSYLNDPDLRNKLLSEIEKEDTLEINAYEQRYANPTFSNLKANSDSLIAELLRFTLSQRGNWTERFFEYLIF